MNNTSHTAGHPIYPKRYFDASSTWFAWNKLTAADVHALREEAGFEGQNIFFWLNHPIRYVRIVGIVAQIDLVGSGKYTLVTIDDSSGANIEIKIEKRQQVAGNDTGYPSNTTVDNVDILVELGLPTVLVDKTPVEVGTILRTQGSLITWRQERQLELKRVWRVRDTNDEAIYWAKVAEWKETVLGKPWILSPEQRNRIDLQLKREEQRARKRAKAYSKRKAQNEEDLRRGDVKDHEERQKQTAHFDNGALAGSELLP